MSQAAFFELYHPGLPRLAPGSHADTARALALVPGLPAAPEVLDLGCGNGAQGLSLARLLPGARLTAVDLHEPFLEVLRRRAAEAGLRDRIMTLRADMARPPFPPASFDLLWCEGAVYNLGLAEGLRAWRPLLRPGGCLGLTDIAWFLPDAPPELRAFWEAECPGMLDEAAQDAAIRAAGYELVGSFRLADASWWDEYYAPLEAELPGFEARHAGRAEYAAVAEATRLELAMHRRHAAFYGYRFLICRPAG